MNDGACTLQNRFWSQTEERGFVGHRNSPPKKCVTLSQNHFEEDVLSCLYLRHYVLGITEEIFSFFFPKISNLPSWNIHELPFSHCLKSPFHNTRKIILFCYKTVVSSHLEYSMKFWHFTSKEGKHQWKSFKWSSGLD